MKKVSWWILCGCLIGMQPLSALASTPQPASPPTLEERIQKLEQAIEPSAKNADQDATWTDRLRISGLIEVEANYGRIDVDNPDQDDETVSDVDLATVELGVDIDIIQQVTGHVLFTYEEDDLFVDEGFITMDGGDNFPAYLIAGRQYLPFGIYESHFITDPNTLILGETNEGAVVAGYRFGGDLADLSLGVFNGKAQASGNDDHIDSWVAAVSVHPIEHLTLGLSYTSNLAGSDGLNEVCVDPENLDSLVGGIGAFAQLELMDRFTLIGEYLSAVDHFKAGELFDPSQTAERKPSAWNFELGAALTEDIQLAVRYGGANDGADLIPETQYGAVVSWGCFKHTTLALEYLHAEFEDDIHTTDTVTAQLAVEF